MTEKPKKYPPIEGSEDFLMHPFSYLWNSIVGSDEFLEGSGYQIRIIKIEQKEDYAKRVEIVVHEKGVEDPREYYQLIGEGEGLVVSGVGYFPFVTEATFVTESEAANPELEEDLGFLRAQQVAKFVSAQIAS
ncbi:MAG: hypothetical protein AAB531_01575 [Patescibacteria group bacterium]